MNTIIGTAKKKNCYFVNKSYCTRLAWKALTSIVNILSMKTNTSNGKPFTSKVRYSQIYQLLMRRIKIYSIAACVKAIRIIGQMSQLILNEKQLLLKISWLSCMNVVVKLWSLCVPQVPTKSNTKCFKNGKHCKMNQNLLSKIGLPKC